MPQGIQEEEEPTQGKVDKGLQEVSWQGVGSRPQLWVRKEKECSGQVRPLALAELHQCYAASGGDQEQKASPPHLPEDENGQEDSESQG